ncbi:MAG: AMP-dependent synthetase [Rhodospirillaceae bacterium]|nr:AMP-dependent synthetase [Rhodospirillaceae bacterium]
MNFAQTLSKTTLTFADRPAISKGTMVIRNYGELSHRVAHLASAMRGELGLKKGDRVALIMTNCVETLEVLYACWHAGLAAVPVNAKLHPREFGFILSDSGTRACFVTSELIDSITDARTDAPGVEHMIDLGSSNYDSLLQRGTIEMEEVAPTDLAWLFYTSGTTGRPKGAMLSHRNLFSMTMNYLVDVDVIEPGDSMIHAAPMSHGSGLYALPHIARGANNVIPESGGFNVAETIQLIGHWQGVTFFFAPTMVTRLINSPDIDTADFSNLKTIVYGGAPMYLADTLKALDLLGPKLVQIYGQGESPMTITGLPKRFFLETNHPRYHDRLSSAGLARTDVEVQIVDDRGSPLPMGEIGEITCRGDVVMLGYWKNPKATANSLKNGWLWTGDIGIMDNEGFLTLKDRSKDMIISGGTNIYPREIEEVLLRHPSVLECAVVGRPHPDWGEEVVAFVVPHAGQNIVSEQLDTLCLDHIARFKRPKEYRVVDALAKNNYGKILKTELREKLERERAG